MRTHRLNVILVLLCVALVGTCAPASAKDEPLVNGVFVGTATSRAYVAIVADEDGIIAYLCDGEETGTWFTGASRTGNVVDLTSTDGAEHLTADLRPSRAVGTVTYQGRTLPFALQPAEGNAGLFRAAGDQEGNEFLAGTIVLNNGKERGTVAGAKPTNAPPLGQVVTTKANQVIVIDLTGDGIDLTGTAKTTLVDGAAGTYRWTRPGEDDAFLAIDATAVRSFVTGYEIRNAAGTLLDGMQLVRGGLMVKNMLTVVTTTATSAWHMLQLLELGHDNVISSFEYIPMGLREFRDLDAQGDIDAGEIGVTGLIIAINIPTTTTTTTDASGNVLQSSTYVSPTGVRKIVGVALKRL